MFGKHAEFVLTLRQELGWWEGAVLTGYTVTYKKHTVLLIVKAKRANGRFVCFYECETEVDCWRALYYGLHHKPGLHWVKDRYAKSD